MSDDEVRSLSDDWTAVSDAVQSFGVKTVGLVRLPAKWRPPGLAISSGVYSAAQTNGRAGVQSFLDKAASRIAEWLAANPSEKGYILRSSGTHETMLDRGKFKSIVLQTATPAAIADAANEICADFTHSMSEGAMALLLQAFHRPLAQGHLTNHRRVSKTRNQWEYEATASDLRKIPAGLVPYRRFNSQRRLPTSPDHPLPTAKDEGDLKDVLQGAAAWIAQNIEPVVSLEWVIDEEGTWIVQCDDEVDPPGAVDPKHLHLSVVPVPAGDPAMFKPFALYMPGTMGHVKKLRLLDDFHVPDFSSEHRIFWATGALIDQYFSDPAARIEFAQRIDQFAPNKVVIRTDAIDAKGDASLNLPRTDSANGSEAVAWLLERLHEFKTGGTALDRVVFLLHRFIAARCSAWAYFKPGDDAVQVDSIWGLPDGLVYPHDNHEYNLASQSIVRSRIAFKPFILWPDNDGTWRTRRVQAALARSQPVRSEDISYIAQYTKAISDKIGGIAQIMWFCDFENGTGLVKPLPWFRVMDPLPRHHKLEAAPQLPSIEISSSQDLATYKAAPETRRHRIVLRPDADVIRKVSFIEGVVDVARSGSHVIVFDGSTSCHAFHIIAASGVPTYSTHGSGRRRALRRREFGKLVRDKIPERIAQGGEAVTFAQIPEQLRRQLLIAKAYEELWELSEAQGSARVEELADLFEVFRTLLTELGIPLEEVQRQADSKASKRGGFGAGLVLIETKLAEDEEEPTLLEPDTRRLLQTSPQRARTSALQVERDGNAAALPVFRLLAEQKGAAVRLPFNETEVVLQCRIEGDRFIVEVIPPEEEADLLPK